MSFDAQLLQGAQDEDDTKCIGATRRSAPPAGEEEAEHSVRIAARSGSCRTDTGISSAGRSYRRGPARRDAAEPGTAARARAQLAERFVRNDAHQPIDKRASPRNADSAR